MPLFWFRLHFLRDCFECKLHCTTNHTFKEWCFGGFRPCGGGKPLSFSFVGFFSLFSCCFTRRFDRRRLTGPLDKQTRLLLFFAFECNTRSHPQTNTEGQAEHFTYSESFLKQGELQVCVIGSSATDGGKQVCVSVPPTALCTCTCLWVALPLSVFPLKQ